MRTKGYIPGSEDLYTALPFTVNALEVMSKRYLKKDKDGAEIIEDGKTYHKVIETPEQMFTRVSKTLAEVELKYGKSKDYVNDLQHKFYEMMANFEFIPAGRTLANAGLRNVINNCLVLHVEDSIDSIGSTLSDALALQQLGVGIGFPWDLLRPAGTFCKRTEGTASGPCSFLHLYNTAFGVIKQQNRHGKFSYFFLEFFPQRHEQVQTWV